MNCSRVWKPVVIMLAVSFALAVVNLFLKKVLNEGMNQLIIVTYRQSIAAIFLAPIAYFWERRSRPKLTAQILFQFFLSALIGLVMTFYIDGVPLIVHLNYNHYTVIENLRQFLMFFRVTFTQFFFLLGLQYTSATFACAFLNMVPVNTFLLALPFGLEKVNLKTKGGMAKVLGTLVCVSGALLLTLYKGMPLSNTHSQASTHITNHGMLIPATRERWAIGSIFLVAGSLMWSSWFLIQARIGKRYPCQYSSTAILNFFGAIQSCILSLIIKRNLAMWLLKGSLEILSILYAGMVGSGLCYVAMSRCLKQRGPVFTSAFTPFIQIFVAIFDFSVLREQMYLGSILGSILVISGMYVLLWGKSSEGAECAKQGQAAEEDPKCKPVLPITNQP